ncbi:hypothetical protein SADUNF_Sadunf01G0068700 [Salix dunnii]|uniref:Uncharacterized protein n=1 Tax=Salix dunnii TaxID=1413687 RepID=A0A835NAW6_9ROSI|nr:hypothetical protein SADUNF_Sadunf01G0068700 [Salix dunnii]
MSEESRQCCFIQKPRSVPCDIRPLIGLFKHTSNELIQGKAIEYASFAVFNISSIQEPWLVADTSVQEKPSNVLVPILQKLDHFETDATHSWDEPYTAPTQVAKTSQEKKQQPRKSVSIHTLEELEAKLAPKPLKELEKKTEPIRTRLRKVEAVSKPESQVGTETMIESAAGGVVRSVKENIFIVRDTLEREKGGKPVKRDLTGEVVGVPRVFIKGGRCIGGGDEFVELNESGRHGRILVWALVDRDEGRHACEGCGDARFEPCLGCGGSCKFKQATNCMWRHTMHCLLGQFSAIQLVG